MNEIADRLHRSAVVIDGVAPDFNLQSSDKWREGGATVVAPTLPYGGSGEVLAEIGRWQRLIEDTSNRLRLVTTVEDVLAAKEQGNLGVLFHVQTGNLFEDNLDLVRVFAALGVRMVQLTYNVRNRIADGCGERADGGLSEFGRRCVSEMNRAGIIVDCSHTGHRATLEAIDQSVRPPVFSHANAKALCDNGRNITDEQARIVAEKRGLVGVCAFPAFLKREYQQTSIRDVLAHLDYWVNLIGIDHVALGLDFFSGLSDLEYQDAIRKGLWYTPDYPPPPHPYPTGLTDARELPNITRGLAELGYIEEDIEKILGKNWLRVFAANWQDAAGSFSWEPQTSAFNAETAGRER